MARRILQLAWAMLALGITVVAQPPLRLKTRSIDREQTGNRGDKTTKRRNLQRRHWLVQFPSAPEPSQLAALRQRGVKILGYVPDFALSVSAVESTDFEGLGLRSVSVVASDSKVSAEVKRGRGHPDREFVVVEFYPDVDMNDARAILLEQQLNLQDSPDLLQNELLASGRPDQIMALGLWEEVSYIFPASDELIQGLPVHACAGALTDQGPIGQTVVSVGEGWDGHGNNGADLNYAFVNTTPKLQPEAVKAEVARAFAEWAKHAKLTFTQTGVPGAGRTIGVFFGSRNHGDAYPFDGPGGVLGHTFYPYPVNPEPIAGDVHLDADENWNIGADVDLFSVALHEVGHALGLGHSDKPGAVMYPYYRQGSALTAGDIAAILTMYAARDGSSAATNPVTLTVAETAPTTSDPSITLHGSASGGAGVLTVSWTSNRGFSGTAAGSASWISGPITLGSGINLITVVAKDPQGTQGVRTLTIVRQAVAPSTPVSSPRINITTPSVSGTYASSNASVTVLGTASDASGIARVMWSNSRGGSGPVSGTTSWSTGPIGLQSGMSTITITAVTLGGASVSKTVQVSYSAPVAGSSTAPPSLTIVSPSATSVSSAASSLSMNGTARDSAGIRSVTWTNSTGVSGAATGTNTWSIAAIALLVGTNTITVQATNVAGVIAWRSVVVTRR